jgi:plastocyanin
MERAVPALAALGLLVAAAAGCGGSTKPKAGGEGGGKKTIAGLQVNDHGTKSVSDEAEVELDDYYFAPTVLKGRSGSSVTLELKNEGKVEHNFTLAAQQIDKDLEAGEHAKVTVTVPPSGQLSFYCKYHKSVGMAGALAPKGGSGGMTGSGGTTSSRSSY